MGARILVEELVTSLSIRERGKLAGLLIITNEDDELKNQCTMGIILALGTDPFLQENGLEVGKIVYFDRHNGNHTFLEGKRYRTLEFQHITNVLDELPSDARRLSEIEKEADL
jgi:co-chaperonin GroES (HSP10)